MMDDDKQIRPHAETPDFPVERTELPEWRQVPTDDEPPRRVPTHDSPVADHGNVAPADANVPANADAGTDAAPDPAFDSYAWDQSPSGQASGQASGQQSDQAVDQPPGQPERIPAPTGPAWGTLAFGIVCLAVAGGALALQFVDVTVDWRYAAPLAFAGVGALLVVVGLIGLASRRTRE